MLLIPLIRAKTKLRPDNPSIEKIQKVTSEKTDIFALKRSLFLIL